jgi:Flp pilus assembly protein TadD
MRKSQVRLALGALWLCGALAACATSGSGGRPSSTPSDIARLSLARQLTERGDWGRAFELLDDIHRQHPDDPQVLTLRGIVYRERGLFADAEADLRAALRATPSSAEAHAALGILFDVQMRPDAEREHREAVRLSPNSPAYLNNLGFSLFLRQHFKDAITEYEKAAQLAPLSRRVRTNMGFAYAALGDLPRASREFRMGGTEAEAKNNLGFAYERRGDMANAFDLYLESVRIDPSANRARSNLVHAAAVLGRPVPPEATAPPPPPKPEPDGPAAAFSPPPDLRPNGPAVTWSPPPIPEPNKPEATP